MAFLRARESPARVLWQSVLEKGVALQRLNVIQELGEKWFISRSLEMLAAVTSIQGDHRRAAWLFRGRRSAKRSDRRSFLPFYGADYNRDIAALRDGLDEHAFAAAWAKGKAMTLEETIAYALEEPALQEEEVAHPPAAGTASAEVEEAPPETYPEALTA